MRLATAVPYMQAGSKPAPSRGPSFTAIPQAPGQRLLPAAVPAMVQTPRLEGAQRATTASPTRRLEVQAVQRSAGPSGQTSTAPLAASRLGGRPHSPRGGALGAGPLEACGGTTSQCTSVPPALAQQLLLQGGRMGSRVTIGSCNSAGLHSAAAQQWAQASARGPHSPAAVVQTAVAPQPQPQVSPGQGVRRLQSAPPHSWYPTRTPRASTGEIQGASDTAHIATVEEGLDEREEVPEEVGDSARVRTLLQDLEETRRERDDLRRERDALLEELRGARTREPAVPPLPMGSPLLSRGSLQAAESHVTLPCSSSCQLHPAGGSHFGQDDTLEILVSVPRAFTDSELQEAAQERYGQTPRGDVTSQCPSGAPVLAGVREDM